MKKIIIFSFLAVFSISLGMESCQQMMIRCGVSIDVGNSRTTQEDGLVFSSMPSELNKTLGAAFISDLTQKRQRYSVDKEDAANCFAAIYDGHGGNETVSFVKENLHNTFFAEIKTGKPIKESLFSAFEKTEKSLLDIFNNVPKNQQSDCRSGSTATVSCIQEDVLHVANLGDTRLVLVMSDGMVLSTNDLDVYNPEEVKRITALGGKIENQFMKFRSDGSQKKYLDIAHSGLEVSAAFGNFHLDPEKKILKSVPDYYRIPLEKKCDILIIASDGVWVKMTNEQAVEIVYEELEKGTSVDSIAECLKNKAIELGSKDNISVIIILLNDAIQKPNEELKVQKLEPESINYTIPDTEEVEIEYHDNDKLTIKNGDQEILHDINTKTSYNMKTGNINEKKQQPTEKKLEQEIKKDENRFISIITNRWFIGFVGVVVITAICFKFFPKY